MLTLIKAQSPITGINPISILTRWLTLLCLRRLPPANYNDTALSMDISAMLINLPYSPTTGLVYIRHIAFLER